MHVFRLTRKRFANAFDGKGAALFGNRWNSKGTEIIYTAESRALAMAEVLVHTNLNQLPEDYVILTIEIPHEIKIKVLPLGKCPEYWNEHPPQVHSQYIGDEFVAQNEFAVLKVPSAVVLGDTNLLINPHHSDFKNIKVVDVADFPFDSGMFTAGN